MQHLWRSKYVNLISGIGYFNINATNDLTVDLNLPPPPDGPGPTIITETIDNDVRHVNLYVYSYISLLKNVTFTLGASGDFFDTEIQPQRRPTSSIRKSVWSGTHFQPRPFVLPSSGF